MNQKREFIDIASDLSEALRHFEDGLTTGYELVTRIKQILSGVDENELKAAHDLAGKIEE